jgi:hypothetical protein
MDQYRIGVSIALANGVSPVLAIIAKDLLGIRSPIGEITKQFESWNAKLIGVAGILGGTAIVGGLLEMAKHGDKLLDQQDKMMRAGLQYADVLKLQGTYYNSVANAVPTSTAAEFLKTTNELRAVTGNTDEAAALAPKAMMVDTLLSNALGREMHGEYYKLLRSAEMKGISTDPEKLQQFTDQVFSYITAFGGKLSAEDFQTLARRGGTAFMNAKPEAIGPLAVLAADLGGSAAGTTIMTLQQLQTGANTLAKQQGQTLGDLGLLDMSKTTPTGFGGSRLQLAPGAMKGSLEHIGDLPGWIKDTVYPALEKASHGDEALLQSMIAKISPNRNAAKLIEMFGDPKFLAQQGKDLGLAGQVEPIPDAYKHFIDRNPVGVHKAFDDQYDSMLQAIGAPMMQAALPVMRDVTSMFNSFGALANAHPEAIKIMAEAVAAIGIALVGAGAATLIALAGFPAIVTGIVAAAAALVALNWSAIESMFTGIASAISAFIDAIAALYHRITGGSGWGPARDETGHIKNPGLFDRYIWGDPAPHELPPINVPPDEGLKKKTMFEPGISTPRAQQIGLSLNIDGRTLAQAISDELANLYGFPTGAPASDDVSGYNPAGGRSYV